MKILLIQAFLGANQPIIYPLGLSYLATALKDHEVKIFDPNLSDEPFKELRETTRSFKPDIAGISIRNIDNQERRNFIYYFKYLQPTLKTIKEAGPDTRIVVGGAGFSMFSRAVMERFSEIDYGIYLEGEESFPELLGNLENPEKVPGIYFRRNNKVIFSGERHLPDFASLPVPRKDLVDIRQYAVHRDAIGIQTKRGCAYRCCYCTYYNLNGNIVRARSPKQIVDEIEELTNRYGISSFMFADAIFNIPAKHANEICQEIIDRGLKATWSCWCEPKNVTREFLILAKKAGCNFISYSPDALSVSALHSLRKGISKKDVDKVYRLANEIDGIRTEFGFFISPPGETIAGLLSTLWFFIKANFVLVLKKRGAVGLNWIRVEPDTMIYDIAVRENVIKRNSNLLPNYTDGEGLFYTQPKLKKFNFLIDIFLNFVDFIKGRKGKTIKYGRGPQSPCATT